MNIFFFCHNVFKSDLLLICQLGEKGLVIISKAQSCQWHIFNAIRVCPSKPARHDQDDPCRLFTQRPQCLFSRETAHMLNVYLTLSHLQTHLTRFQQFLSRCFQSRLLQNCLNPYAADDLGNVQAKLWKVFLKKWYSLYFVTK